MNNSELVQSYRQQIGNVVNQANLQLFWNMYNRCGGGAPRLAGLLLVGTPRHAAPERGGHTRHTVPRL